MKPETMDKISELLNNEKEKAKADLLYAIEHGYKNEFDKRIAAYREAHEAYMDFEEWREEQED